VDFPLGIIFSAVIVLFAACAAFFTNVDMFILTCVSVVGLVCFAIVVSWGAAITKIGGEAQRDNAHENDVTDKKYTKNSEITARNSVHSPYPPNNKDEYRYSQDGVWCRANYYFWKITRSLDSFGSLITALATAALVAVTICLAVIARQSDETSRITNRPYVFLQDISVVSDGRLWNLIPQWVNGGNITTKDMKIKISSVGFAETPGVSPGWTRCDISDTISGPSVPNVLGPKQISSVAFLTVPGEVFSSFQAGRTKKLYIWGKAIYRDDFSLKRRITRFCFDTESIVGNPSDPKDNIRFFHSLCAEGNCTDEECDKEDASLPPAICPAPMFQSAN
jgi:hypothetical protein